MGLPRAAMLFSAAAVLALYPLVVYFAGTRGAWGVAFSAIAAASLLRLALTPRKSPLAKAGLCASLTALALVALSALMSSYGLMLWYPVIVNASLLALFSFSLTGGHESAVTMLARTLTPDLPDYAVAYTRKVTVAWCVFFTVNGAIALATVLLGNMKAWAFYNGLASYVLMGMVAAGEYAIRRRVRRLHGD